MTKCSLCGKGTAIGRNRSHAQNRTPRTFKANVQKVTLNVGSEKISGVYCSKCLKKMKGEIKKARRGIKNDDVKSGGDSGAGSGSGSGGNGN